MVQLTTALLSASRSSRPSADTQHLLCQDTLFVHGLLVNGKMGQSPVVQLTNALLEYLWQTQLLVWPTLYDDCCADTHLLLCHGILLVDGLLAWGCNLGQDSGLWCNLQLHC